MLLALVLMVPMAVPFAQIATADDGLSQFIGVKKSVDNYELVPGQAFTYTIVVTCSEESCLNAQLLDELPAELEGYALQRVSFTPAETSIPRAVTWTTGGIESAAAPGVIGSDTRLKVDFTGAVSEPVGVGLQSGNTFSVSLNLQVPNSVAPGRTADIVNTAEVTATNSLPDSDEAAIIVDSPILVDVDPTKTWSPDKSSFAVGAASSITLGATNKSNVPVDSIVIQEPKTAADGETALDKSNPFTITEFDGFGASSLPDGADTVQVDAFVKQSDGSWAWQAGAFGTTPALPDGVDAADVGGLRFTYTGDGIEPDAAASVELDLKQLENHRNTGEGLSEETHAVENVASATVTLDDRDPVTKDAIATYTVTPAAIGVSTAKTIEPARIGAGESAKAQIRATNDSEIGVDELKISDRGYFTEKVRFGGFVDAPEWPETATGGEVTYYPLNGDPAVTVTLEEGEIPVGPGDILISGFDVVFTAADGGIAPASSASLSFGIDTLEDATADAVTLLTTNTATSSVAMSGPDGENKTASDDDSADLTLVKPGVDVALKKTVTPSTPVAPGDNVYTVLEANMTTTSSYVTPHDIVITDAWDNTTPGQFWDGFNLSAVAPTQVPGGTSLTVDVQGADGNWVKLSVFDARTEAFVVSMTTAEIEAALSGSGVDITELTGVRFSFENEVGFSENTTVKPVVVSEARGDLRTSGGIPIEPGSRTEFVNSASVIGSGETGSGTDVEDSDDDVGLGTVETPPVGVGPVDINKKWNKTGVAAQSGEQASTSLNWKVSRGFKTVTITDPVNPEAPVESVFEAFDLVGVNPIAANDTAFSNGWFLKYDLITDVELYHDGGWQSVPIPDGGWIQNGRFIGYTLTHAERAAVTGVRLVLAEDEAARVAAADAGTDPFAPAVGSGIAASSGVRAFDLTWQVRDMKRPEGDDPWVTASKKYNTDDAGDVNNTVRLVATPLGGGVDATAEDADLIKILDFGPGVKVSKTVDPRGTLFVPAEGTAQANYPTSKYTLAANSDSVARASYLRVTDPGICADSDAVEECLTEGTAQGALSDPFSADVEWLTTPGIANPFDRLNLTDVNIAASIPAEVDLAESTAWLLRYDATLKTFSSVETTAAAVNGMSATELADVVGISVTFQGSDPANTGGTISQQNRFTIELSTQVRTHIRSTGEPQILASNANVSVPNQVSAQSYDPILADGETPGAIANANVQLTGGDLNVAPTKTVTPGALTEPTRNNPVAVTLGANQGVDPTSSLAPSNVWLRDDITSSPAFWNQFDFTGLGELDAPAGADQVEIDVFGPFGTNGALDWKTGDASTLDAAAVPVAESEFADIQGIRVNFSRADGGYFAEAVPAPRWSAQVPFTVQLREAYRDSAAPVALVGTIENTVTVQSERKDGSSDEKTSIAPISLSPGTQELQVRKLANDGVRIASAGTAVPWDLEFKNNGTGYLTVTELRDALPSSLVYTGEKAPTYTAAADGLLSEDVTLTEDGGDLVFTWPEDGRRMAPGETFTIRLDLELQPGLQSGQRATNSMTVQTAETLLACSNIDPSHPAGTTDAFGQDPTLCETTDYVAPATGENLFNIKGVRGSLDGAYNPANPDQVCRQSLTTSDGDFFRAPCVANSQIGGVDEWVLHVLNAGTVNVDSMVVFDQLPVADDRSLISGRTRGSVYRPEMVADSLKVNAPGGTKSVVEVTTSAGACVGTWNALTTQEPCEQNSEVWTELDESTDWSQVSGIRVSLDFTDTAQKALISGESIDVLFSTKNMPQSQDRPGGAPSDVPATDSLAWNQFGIKYLNTGDSNFSKLAPGQVGVHLLFGAIEIVKEVTGPATQYASDEFLADVVCTIEDVELNLGEFATVTLNVDNDFTQRIDGIPYGASCTVTEQGAVGEFGETDRSGTPTTLLIDSSITAEQEVPAAQIATITNNYEFSGLAVTKNVQTEADLGAFGPFDFSLVCESSLGKTVTFDGANSLEFTLADGETFTAPQNMIPVGAKCIVTETDASAADEIVIVGDNVEDLGPGQAEVEIGSTPGNVLITNGYDAGILTVEKVVDGDGVDLFGAGPFTFEVVCHYGDQTLLEETFQLEGGANRSFGTFPAGTECAVVETATGGANETAFDAEDGVVVIEGPNAEEAGVGNVSVTATNTFLLGSLNLEKIVDGAGAELYGTGPFEAQLECVWDRDGEEVEVALANDGLVTLSAANDYRATVDNLLVGTKCAVEEVKTGGATNSTIDPADGLVTVLGDEEEAVTVTLTNTFDLTSLNVTKVIEGTTSDDAVFTVELQCTWIVDGIEQPVQIPGGATRDLSPESLEAVYEALPVGAICSVTETETGGADSTSIAVAVSGQDIVTVDGVSADVDLSTTTEPGQAEVILTNVFDPIDDPADETDGSEGQPGDPGSKLPITGSDVAKLVVLAALLIAVGAVIVIRRKRHGIIHA